MSTLFKKYPFPTWIFASGDKVLAGISHLVCSPVVRIFLRLHRCDVGKKLQCDGFAFIRMQRPGAITIGHNVSINTRPRSNLAGIMQRTIIQCIESGSIVLDNNSGISGVVLSARERITVGKHTNIGVNTRIYDHDFHSLDCSHRTDRRTDQAHTKSAPIHIGDDALVGANVIILKGVTIGPRSIVAAGSVVTRGDYPADSLIGGNPATVIRRLGNP